MIGWSPRLHPSAIPMHIVNIHRCSNVRVVVDSDVLSNAERRAPNEHVNSALQTIGRCSRFWLQ